MHYCERNEVLHESAGSILKKQIKRKADFDEVIELQWRV